MRKNIIYLSALFVVSSFSCTKNFTDLNKNPAQFDKPDAESIFTGAVLNTINKMENLNQGYLWEYSHFIEPHGERYNAQDESSWSTLYVNVLGNTKQLKELYKDDPAYANRILITDIWECYVYSILVGTYGPIPYSESGDVGKSVINYDDENVIYTSLLERLKADANGIKADGDKMTPDVLNFSLTQWVKFANSLRLQIALRVKNNLPDLSASNAREVMANEDMLLTSDADNPKLVYSSTVGSQSPNYITYTLNINPAIIPYMSDYIFTYFRSYKDPRLSAYYAKSVVPFSITDTLTSTADNLHYIVSYEIPYLGDPKAPGLVPAWNITVPVPIFQGTASTPSNYSKPQPSLFSATRPFYIMTYAEVCFMKAEAALRGYGGKQSADKYYYDGIDANFAFWGLSATQAETYKAQDGIKWNTAGHGFNYTLNAINTSIPNDNFSRIWIQEWINYYDDNGFEAWCLQRRTRNLSLPPHTAAATIKLTTGTISNLPDRFAYPNVEITNNPTGYKNNVSLLGAGGDSPFTHLKIEPPFTPVNWDLVAVGIDQSYVQKWYGNTIESTAAGLAAEGLKPYIILSTY